MRRLVRLLAVIALALVLAACRVDARVEVEVAEDGSGTVDVAVSLDQDAAERAGDLDLILVTDDLEAAGWAIEPATREADGLTWVRASKPFAEAADLNGVLAEVSPIFDVTLERGHSFAKTSFELEGTIDLSGGVESLGDDQLEALFGSAAGIDVDALEAEIGPLQDAGQLQFVVTMPYDISSDGDEVQAEQSTWTFTAGEAATIEASASQRQPWTLVWAVAAILLGLTFVVVVGRRAWRAVSGADLPLPDAAAIRSRHQPAPAAADDDDAPPSRQLELLVLDAFGVLFDADDDITSVLGPFVAENGGTDDAIEVAERYRQASLGRLSAAEFWSSLRVEGDPEHLDHEFIARVPLTDGALTFLERAKLQGLTVACLANGLSRWFELLRSRDSLDVYCDTWLISSDLGVRKPDPAAYEALPAATGVPLTNCLMIDDRVEHLEAARRVGMSTALFGSPSAEGTGHPHLDNFEALLS